MSEELKTLHDLSALNGAREAILIANRYLRACGYSVAADALLEGADRVLDQVKAEVQKCVS